MSKRILFVLFLLPLLVSGQVLRYGNSVIVSGNKATQYTPTSVVAPFSPSDIPNLVLWLKADAGVTKDGSNYVSSWADQSGNNNHAVQATGSAQPLWVDGVLNNNPVVRFDGINDYLHSAIRLGTTSNITIIVVYKLIHTRNHIWINKLTPLDATSITMYDWDNGSRIYDGAGGIMYNFDAEGYYVFTSLLNGANSRSYNNGVQNLNTPTTMGARDFNDIYIGACAQNAWVAYNGDVSEFIIYDNAISDTDRQLVETYLNTKYALW